MSKKQLIGLIAAAVIFVFVGASSVLVHSFAAKGLGEDLLYWAGSSYSMPGEPFVGVLSVQGTILDVGSSTAFSSVQYDHRGTLGLIDAYENSDSNQGILLYIDSPGGGVYESDEVYLRLMDYKERTGRPVWTYMASQACSGGYYIAMASDRIYANRNAWTGSIGVIISLSNYKGLFDKLGIKSELITSGPNKAMGNGGISMTAEQREIFQSLVDESYEQFVGVVAEGRKMTAQQLKPIADGRIYTAKQALKLGLIDKVGSYEDIQMDMQESLERNLLFYLPGSGGMDLSAIFSAMQEVQPKSELEAAEEFIETHGSGVPMYYAFQ